MFVDQLEHRRADGAFESHADDTFQSLINRIDGLSRTLDGGSALFASQEEITALEWKYYVDTLNIEENLPGILGVGYVALMHEIDGIDISSQFLERGIVLPPIRPDTGLPERFVVQFIEPADTNRSALGLDMGFEPERRRSAQIARETNTIQLTPPIELVQNDGREIGFLLMRPHYRARADISTPEARAEAFEGWLYMPFIGESLFTSLTSQQTQVSSLSVSDRAGDGTEIAVFSNRDSVASENPQFVVTRDVNFFGRNWTLTWHSTPAFERANQGFAKWIVLFLGLIIFSLLVLIFKVFAERERQVEVDVERKTAELRAKNEETLSVIENAVIAVLVLDEDERILSANPAAKALFEKIKIKPGMPIRDVIIIKYEDQEDFQSARCAWCPVLPNLRLRVQRNEWSAANGLGRSTLLVQDVSESEANARKLEANEARWNLAMEGAKIGVFDMDLVKNRSIVSATWRELMGVSDGDSEIDPQADFYSRVHPDDLPVLLAAEKACIEGKTDRSVCEYRMRFDGGSVRWMKSDAVVVSRDENGKALRLVGAQIDETDLRETRDALKASRERFEIVLEQAPVGMAVFSADGRFIGMNAALCRMTGYKEDEMRKGLRFRDLVSPADHKAVMRSIQDLRAKNLCSYQGEYQFLPKNGPAIWGLLNVAWTFDATENKDAFIVQIVDISEKKNIEKMKMEFVA
ncbi:MAG: CHASE domain-containing protein, partial [Octadecabacter sp.]